MRRKMIRLPSGLLGLISAVAMAAAPAPDRPRLPAADFLLRPELDARIEAAHFDRGLMATAIFHETNRVRHQLGLRVFLKEPKLDEAADLEAAVGRVTQPPSHTNPFPKIGTPLQRVEYVGLKPREVAVNIALLSIYDIDPDVGIGTVVRNGRRLLVHPDTLEELKPATYRDFAAKVVAAWMKSPGHRANLVSPTLLYLGCSVQPTVTISGVDSLFCVQVFFTPLT